MDIIAVFSPLAGFIIAGLLGKQIGDRGSIFVTCLFMTVALASSIFLFHHVIMEGNPYNRFLADWIISGGLSVSWGLRIDQLSVVMICVVNIISTCVHYYSIGYMAHDAHKSRFFAYLSLFTFAMLMLVTSDNLLQLFFGWEAVGLTSYLLIGFWNQKKSANDASIKAFLMNRVGDFGFTIGILTIFVLFGTLDFDIIFESASEYADKNFDIFGQSLSALSIIGLLLFVGAVGKSAQLGLHTWLPDAMEGPTPVSALIHAATMVTAGVFLIARFSPLYEYAPLARDFICVIGALTAFMGATIAMTQNDIKRVIAFSTMSQLGYMFFALGVSAYSAAMFHLTTHAFFKALLFLGAGSVIHAMSNEQDMRKMGGIWKLIPSTYMAMWIGSLALAGIPFFSGFYSKDIILESAWATHDSVGIFAYVLGIAAAVMTGFYSWRLLIMTFHGKPKADEKVMAHIHESSGFMLYPISALAGLALFSGFFLHTSFIGTEQPEIRTNEDGRKYLIGMNRDMFWDNSLFVLPENDSVAAAHHVDKIIKYLPIIAGVLGVILAVILLVPLRHNFNIFTSLWGIRHIKRLFENKWYFDDIYNALFVRSAWKSGNFLAHNTEKQIIDRYGPDGMARLAVSIGSWFSRFHTGYVFHYALAIAGGLIALLTWYFIKFSAGL